LRETGFGERLATYDWTTEELVAAVNRLLGDDALHATMARNAEVIRADPGRVNGADLIERVAVTGEPVTR
jgi:UDP:flavonoid glycosyltransferase YjiC (YdhE family)